MKSFKDLMNGRRSVRKFKNTPIPLPLLDEIAQAGRHAPSACNRQPWKFFLVRSEEAVRKLRSCYTAPWFETAQGYILCVGYPQEAWRYKDGRSSSLHIDTAIAVSQMMWAAEDLGLSSTWVCALDREECCRLFGWDIEVCEPICVLALGYAEEDKESLPHIRKDSEEVIEII